MKIALIGYGKMGKIIERIKAKIIEIVPKILFCINLTSYFKLVRTFIL